jgi:methionine aminopeptidase
MMTSQVLRNVLEGPKQFVLNPPENQKPEEIVFEQGEVYTVDILVSSGDGKLRETNVRTTVFKRNPNAVYQLKMKTSRALFSQIQKECGTMAFSLKQFEEEKKARMGIVECQSHQLVSGHGVMKNGEGEISVHFVYTVLLLPNGPLKLSNFWDSDLVKSEKEVEDEELVALFKTSIRPKKKK